MLSAYKDNASVIVGYDTFIQKQMKMVILFINIRAKYFNEGWNSQPSNSNFSISATGSGGEIRDEGATGRGQKLV